jgi:hypothetical protein
VSSGKTFSIHEIQEQQQGKMQMNSQNEITQNKKQYRKKLLLDIRFFFSPFLNDFRYKR